MASSASGPEGSTQGPPLLQVDGLERTIEGWFGRWWRRGRQGRKILRGVSLALDAGEVLGLLGPNGAGKTTTFRLVAGLDVPDAGRVLLRGEDLSGLDLSERVRRGLGYVPQEPSVFRGLSALDNVALALELAGERSPRDKAAEVLEEFGLQDLATQRASTLSGGERRRLELARAVCLRPAVLICDEPLTGVDPKASAELRDLIRELARGGMAVLLTDHNVAEALPACDRASLIVDGVIVEEGTAAELARSESAKALYFGDLWSGARELLGGS